MRPALLAELAQLTGGRVTLAEGGSPHVQSG
jgi:hypothetical protein